MNTGFQIIRYLLVGGGVTALDVLIYNFLTGRRDVPRVPANLVSTTVAMAFGFTLHLVAVFHPHDSAVLVRLPKYIVTVGMSAYCVQSFVIYLVGELWRMPVRAAQFWVERFGGTDPGIQDFIDRMVGKAAAILAGMTWNFLLFKYFVYA